MKQTEWDHNTEHVLPEYFEERGINSYTWTNGLEPFYAATDTEWINFMQKHLTVTLRRSNHNLKKCFVCQAVSISRQSLQMWKKIL